MAWTWSPALFEFGLEDTYGSIGSQTVAPSGGNPGRWLPGCRNRVWYARRWVCIYSDANRMADGRLVDQRCWIRGSYLVRGVPVARLAAYSSIHAALAAALGAFGLAVAANLHAHWAAVGNQHLLAIALAVWPAMTAVPAFVVAFVLAAGLARMRRGD
jgi:hypothetical protein